MKPSCVRAFSTLAGLGRVGLAVWVYCVTQPAALGVPPSKAKVPPTYTKDVAPILSQKCLNCHRRHQIGPFPLETYEQARKRARDIATVAADRLMPPWKPEPGVGPKLKHDQSLSTAEIATLEAWAEAGAPKGDPKDMPPPPRFAEGWKLGPPDLILEPSEDFPFAADAPDTYRCFVIPTNLVKDTFVSAIDFRPSNPRIVHHINAFLDTTGDARKRDLAEPGPGYTSFSGPGIVTYEELSFWAAGHVPYQLPPGVGQRIPRQSDVILQVHYHATGKPEVRPHPDRDLLLPRAGQTGAPLGHRLELGLPPPGGRRQHRGQGDVVHPHRPGGPGRLAAHALARARHADHRDGPEREDPRLDQHPRVGPRLAEQLLFREADPHQPRFDRQGGRPLRQLRTPAEPEFPPQDCELGL